MKLLLAFLFAIIGGAAGILYLAPFISNYVQSAQTFSSPDEAMNTHSVVYLLTGFLAMLFGWAVGMIAGGGLEDLMSRRKN